MGFLTNISVKPKFDALTSSVVVSPGTKVELINQLILAANYKNLIFLPGEYVLDNFLNFENLLSVKAYGAHIKVIAKGFVRGHTLGSHTKIQGGIWETLSVERPSPDSPFWHSVFSIGKYYGNGKNVNNWVIEDVTIINDKPNSNGIVVLGGCKNWTINRITAPDSSTLGRVVAVHWGSDKKVEDGTEHPRGEITNINVGKLTHIHLEVAPVSLAGYGGVTVRNVSCESAASGLIVLAGDFGWKYQKPTVSGGYAHITNVRVGSVWYAAVFAKGFENQSLNAKIEGFILESTHPTVKPYLIRGPENVQGLDLSTVYHPPVRELNADGSEPTKESLYGKNVILEIRGYN